MNYSNKNYSFYQTDVLNYTGIHCPLKPSSGTTRLFHSDGIQIALSARGRVQVKPVLYS